MNHRKDIQEAKKFSAWRVIDPATEERKWIEDKDVPLIADLIKFKNDTLDREKKREIVLKQTLNALGLTVSDNEDSLSILCKSFLNAKIQFDNESYTTVESQGGYISKTAKGVTFKDSYLAEFPNLLNGCHIVEGDTISEDEEKAAQVML